jgi:hypothetical protein
MKGISRLAVAAGVCAAAVTAVAAAGRPLPAFPLTALDGSVVQSADAVPDGRTVLIVVQDNCAPCDTLFRAIKTSDKPELPEDLVFVVTAANEADAARMKAKHKELENAKWFADPDLAGYTALELKGLPVVHGLRDRSIEWSLSGAAVPPARFFSMLSNWVSIPPPPDRGPNRQSGAPQQ